MVRGSTFHQNRERYRDTERYTSYQNEQRDRQSFNNRSRSPISPRKVSHTNRQEPQKYKRKKLVASLGSGALEALQRTFY